MHKLFDLATLWDYLPMERRNPIDLVKIRNVTMRSKESIVLSSGALAAGRVLIEGGLVGQWEQQDSNEKKAILSRITKLFESLEADAVLKIRPSYRVSVSGKKRNSTISRACDPECKVAF